jgi:aminoglycoside N3'-acetyltransferase
MITKSQIRNSLLKVGLRKNMTLLMSSSLISLGKIPLENYYETFLDEIIKIIGKKGTLCVNSYTTDIVRYNKIYLGKKTPSNAGGFDNFLRGLRSSFTSDHPAHSVTAYGHYARFICNNNGLNNYDLNSPYFKLLNLNAKILRLGVDYDINTFSHVAEALCGAPYFYCKWIKVKNKKNHKFYSMYVRHLTCDLHYDLEKLKRDLDLSTKVRVKSCSLGSGKVHLLDANEYFNHVKKKISKDPHYFLKKKPKYKKGQIPFDGPSQVRDGVVKK